MARIRALKPEFWTDANVVQLTPYARLLFMGCWNFALCEQGHLADSPAELKMKVLPADPVNAEELVDELVKYDRIVRGTTATGRPYLWIRKLSEHQKSDSRWTTRCFVCSEDSPEPTEEPANSPILTETHPSLDESGDDSPQCSKGREGTKTPSAANAAALFAEFWSVYPRKVGKQDAEKVFHRQRKKHGHERILDGASRYATSAGLPEPQFIPHPSTWLARGGWDDEMPHRVDQSVPEAWR